MTFRAVWLLLTVSPVFPQILYNEQRDKQAQEVQKLGADLRNSAVFQKAIDNLDILWKQREDSVLRNAQDQMNARLAVLETWGQVTDFMKHLSDRIGSDATASKLNTALESLKKQEAQTQSTLADLKKKLAALPNSVQLINSLGSLFDKVGKLDQIVAFAQDKTGSSADQVAAAKEAERQLQSLATEYKAFTLGLSASPGALFLKDQLEVIKMRETNALNVIAIEMRKQKELGAIRNLMKEVNVGLACLSESERSETIAATLSAMAARAADSANPTREKDDECLQTLTFELYNYAALAARGDTAARLAAIRSSLEDRASALRLSAAGTRQIEELINNGVTRLAMFHKGGLKPETLAQLIQALGTAGIIPALVLK